MKKWPKNKAETVPVDCLIDPIVAAFKVLYDVQQKAISAPYAGYRIGADETAGCLQPTEALSAKYLRHAEQNGQEPITVLLHIAFLLGMEQGRRKKHGAVLTQLEVVRRALTMTPAVSETVLRELLAVALRNIDRSS